MPRSRSIRVSARRTTIACTWTAVIVTLILTACAESQPPVAGSPSVSASAPSPITDDQEAALVSKAEELAFYDGEPSPSSAEAVAGTLEGVSSTGLVSIGDPPGREILLAQLTGAFEGHLAKVPAAEDIPTGSVLWFILDADTLELRAWGIGLSEVDLSTVGDPFPLPLETPITEDAIG